ncbi:uncharacterized protein PHACADRAFT_210479 [Phanerochaete carnosa HHB-10118-sp]|uniref:Uncharacterized protein n=1 Tax=Phanerochaete carnosa (strain HHB-10118-sp) TaxID=650164 RepID=K5VT41_PHACS|nr:uncharacterized protein PHACADRAFT_210479 [Phanerochaete carnosa HHB-10118-sp]EKM54693.1 hypothetical protein PHACADRAFT_210479 [Phanerochaete carnosa HHB-10118-sp]
MIARFNLQRLPIGSYRHPRSSVMGRHERDHLFFSHHNVEGVNLADAHAGRLENLDGRDEGLFPATFAKLTCLITIRGYEAFRQVKNVQRVRGGVPVPVPRHKVVRCIAEVMLAFLHQASAQAARAADGHSGAFAFGPAGLQMEHLYLLELQRHGKTLVPIFGFVPPDVSPVVLPDIDIGLGEAFEMAFLTHDRGFWQPQL